MQTQTYRVKGMHCASCASVIERTVGKIKGVEMISVNNGTENAKISFDAHTTSPHHFNEKLEPLGYSLVVPQTAEEMGMSADEHAAHLGLNQSKQEKLAEIKDMKAKVMSAIPLAIFSVFVMGWEILAKYNIVAEMNLTIEEL